MIKQTLIILFSIINIISFGQNKKDININYMLRGQIYANSSIIDSTALGGFGSSSNSPKSMKGKFLKENNLFLKIDTTKIISITEKHNGYNFYIGNKTDSIIKLDASDSRLYVIAEVYYKKKWQPIIYLPSSWCGNSYHTIYLKPNEYWEFKIPKFRGKIKTKIRYRLMIGKSKYIYSNEIIASFNKGQLNNKEGHKPTSIMDSYND